MKKGLYLLLALVILGSLLIAGCQGDGEAPASVDVLTLYGIDPWTLDPAVSGDATSHEYIVQIFSGLVRPGDNL
ncbi:MAG: peptide ABC transporter substrate-binding protein, partial [Chloroflexi bacterium]|nr:peptide ABC transporter substrate-binding protein [Chloroflexota bacterium]